MASKPLYHKQLGFSLIEVMVSLLVISVGLLGLGGLQITSLKGSNNAHFRTVASLFATDLADRMRANPKAVAANQYASTYTVSSCSTPPAKMCEATVVCNPQELASYDLHRVNCGVSLEGNQTGGAQYDLPKAFMSVSCVTSPCTATDEHTILVRWNEVDDDDRGNQEQVRSFSLSFIP